MKTPLAENLLLALATKEGPTTIEELHQWNLGSPSALWGIIRRSLQTSVLAEDDGHGTLWFREEESRLDVLRSSPSTAWRHVLAHPRLAENAAGVAAAAVRSNRFAHAEALYRGILENVRPEDWPGGRGDWLRLFLQGLRLFLPFSGWWSRQHLGELIEVAEATGDLGAKAVLLATRSYLAHRSGESAGEGDFREAREAAGASGHPRIIREVRVLQAASLKLEGKFRECIAVYEEYLGDLPPDGSPERTGAPSETEGLVPEALCGPLVLAYALTGQSPRALDLGHRLLDEGLTSGREPLVHYARLLLALIHQGLRDLGQVRLHAEAAFSFWRTNRSTPLYQWLSATTRAWVFMSEGRVDETVAMLEFAQKARLAAGNAACFGSALLDVLCWLEEQGVRVPGFDVDLELERLLDGSNVHTKGIAHRYLVRRVEARFDPADPEGVRTVGLLYQRSEELLRMSGSRPELLRTLESRASWAERCGRADEAAHALAEARKVQALLAPDPGGPTARQELERTILELGRLSAVRQGDGMWGELAARLCENFRAERCVIAQDETPVRILAARGGSASWLDAVRAHLMANPAPRSGFHPPIEVGDGPLGRLAVVRFVAAGSGKDGWICFENHRSRWLLGESDPALLDSLGIQMGVIVDNLLLREHLVDMRNRLEAESRYFQDNAVRGSGVGIIGDSPPIRRALQEVSRVAPSDTTVLIQGETGVGKELFARAIHEESRRAAGPFVVVNVASLAPGLVSSALFGHEKGAFTGATAQVPGRFELADKGTIFLDEIGELAQEDQIRLLRVLQEGTFERVGGNRTLRSDFRLVAATNRDLVAEIEAGRFRQDLFYRLNVFPLRIPPLRERADDIPALALSFMERCGQQLGRRFEGIGEADMARLVAHSWPGNVRELAHLIERAAVLSDGPRLIVPPPAPSSPAKRIPEAEPPARLPTLEEAERCHVREVLQRTAGRVTGPGGAAEILGMKPSTLNYRIGKLGLRAELARIRSGRNEGRA